MGKLESDLRDILNQFISIDDLLSILVSAEETTKQDAAIWLLDSNILGRTRELVFIDRYLLKEFKRNNEDFYNAPINTLTLIAQGEEVFFTDCIGFARQRLLIDMRNKGLNISDDLIKESVPYISKKSYERDDNFYKNQCLDLKGQLEKLQNNNTQKPQKISEVHRYAAYLNKSNPLYFQNLELLARLHHVLNAMNDYSGRSNKDDRIKDFLKDHGAEYGYSVVKPFHIKMLSSFIHIIKDQKPTSSILRDLEKN